MRFDTIDHGKWFRLISETAKAVMVILGNPLIARTMLTHDIRAGLNVPVRVLIYEHYDGSTRVAYDLPSSLMSGLGNADVTAAATKLDARLTCPGNLVHAPGMCVADLFKSRCRLEAENLFLRINSASPLGVRGLVFECTAVIGRCWYG